MCVSTLKQTLILVVEPNDAGIVREDADAPVVRAELLANLLRGGEDRFLEQIVMCVSTRPAFERDRALECLVRAVFRPGLRERLQLDVGRLPAQISK